MARHIYWVFLFVFAFLTSQDFCPLYKGSLHTIQDLFEQHNLFICLTRTATFGTKPEVPRRADSYALTSPPPVKSPSSLMLRDPTV